MVDDPLLGFGLRPVQLADQALLGPYFNSLAEPLSDYTFSQLYAWRNSLRILWTQIDGHLCVFANGTGDLTLLLPPIGDTGSDRALDQAFTLMDEYNRAHGVADRSRVEYASEELLSRLDRKRLAVEPMGTDYVYDVARMIDLAGGDLKSKRQEKNRFMRNYAHRVEAYDPSKHLDDCLALLDCWKSHQDQQHEGAPSHNAIKRQKESLATELSLRCAAELGLTGMVVRVQDPQASEPSAWKLGGFTFGEPLGRDQSSIVIEKTDLRIKGLAQFIFSEFCRVNWASRPLVNVGDDWGLETLAWTKMSYRPVKMLQKYVLRQQAVVSVAMPEPATSIAPPLKETSPTSDAIVRAAHRGDLAAAVELEATCFSTYCLSKRQLQYLQSRQSTVFVVAEQEGKLVGQGVALLRQHRKGHSGRIYSLAVRPECRGRRIGQRLLREMVDRLAERGAKRIYLEVEASNTAAIALYERNGFQNIGILPDYYGPGRPGVHMMCDLNAQPTLFGNTSANAA